MNLQVFREKERNLLATFEAKVDVLLELYADNPAMFTSQVKAAHENIRQMMKDLHLEFLNSEPVEDPFASTTK
jgi:hypothetical protein